LIPDLSEDRILERDHVVYLDQRDAPQQASDVELGLLDDNTSHDTTENERTNTLETSTQYIAQQRNNLHEVIGDALELFSKALASTQLRILEDGAYG
jgi:hypothetical protein